MKHRKRGEGIWSAFQKNKLGKVLADYQCPECGYYTVSLFQQSKPLKRCPNCGHRPEENPLITVAA